jgi:hypothetical protein
VKKQKRYRGDTSDIFINSEEEFVLYLIAAERSGKVPVTTKIEPGTLYTTHCENFLYLSILGGVNKLKVDPLLLMVMKKQRTQ